MMNPQPKYVRLQASRDLRDVAWNNKFLQQLDTARQGPLISAVIV